MLPSNKNNKKENNKNNNRNNNKNILQEVSKNSNNSVVDEYKFTSRPMRAYSKKILPKPSAIPRLSFHQSASSMVMFANLNVNNHIDNNAPDSSLTNYFSRKNKGKKNNKEAV